MARYLAILIVVTAVLAPPARAQAPQPVQMNALDMLNLYERDRDAAVRNLGDHLGLNSIWDEVRSKGETWIKEEGPQQADRRRLVLATFILEVVNLRDPRERGSLIMARRLLDWVSSDLRDQKVPLPAERLWHMALIALLEHWGGGSYLEAQLLFAEQRFPDEPRWLLIRAWCENHHPMPPPRGPHPCWDHLVTSDHIWETCDAPFVAHTEEKYESAMAVPAIAAEARVEFALLHLKREHYDVVLTLLNQADRMTQDRELRYLSALLQGFAYEAKHDPRRAAGMFQLALNAMPHAQTAAINLGANLILDQQGQGGSARDGAAAFLTGALTAGVSDPWLNHRDAEYRHWPQYIADLRKALK